MVTDSTGVSARTRWSPSWVSRWCQLFVNDGGASVPEGEVDLDAFYRRLAEAKDLPTTAQASVDDLAAAFRSACKPRR